MDTCAHRNHLNVHGHATRSEVSLAVRWVRVKVLTHRIGICPDEIRHAAFAWDLLKPVEDSYVIERLDRWGQPCR